MKLFQQTIKINPISFIFHLIENLFENKFYKKFPLANQVKNLFNNLGDLFIFSILNICARKEVRQCCQINSQVQKSQQGCQTLF